MIVANLVGKRLGFDADDNSAVILWGNDRIDLGQASKTELGRQVVAHIAERYRAAAPRRVTRLRGMS
jgi:phosphopantothenoylcysteine decarboxylase/phosphopantothenate--cysteine ligase